MKAFRDVSYKNAGVDLSTTRKLDTLVVMLQEKRHGEHFANLRRELSKNYYIKRVTWSDYNMNEQVQLMGLPRAMLLSLPGSDVMHGIFLQDNCSVVMYC
jgi:hypothetical protein